MYTCNFTYLYTCYIRVYIKVSCGHKTKIVEEVSEFQIGGLPSYRPSHHLFVVKSVIALYMLMGLAVIIQYFDLRKFFDKEPLRDAMDVLYKCDVPKKAFKLWSLIMNFLTERLIKTQYGRYEDSRGRQLQQ